MINAINQLNSNQRLLRSERKSPNTFNTTVSFPSRFISDSPESNINFISPTTYSLVNQNFTNYTTDAFVYSQLSDLNYRTEPSSSSSSNYHTIRMSPYARQTFYPMYTQRETHSPSSSSYNS
jgi:hypothetical protein